MKQIGTLESTEVLQLVNRLPVCLRFAIPHGSEPDLQRSIGRIITETMSLASSLSYAESAEHIASIDQHPTDFEHALRQREIANAERSQVAELLSSFLSRLDSKEASSVARTAVLSEISAIHARRGNRSSEPISRIAEFQSAILVNNFDGGLPRKRIVEVYSPIYEVLARAVDDHEFLYYFSRHPRKFEIFIADCYSLAGWEQVELTPQRGDGGRDVIATRSDVGTIRILEQTKAYSPGRLVTHDDVRAMIGVLGIDHNSSKGIITTTSDFQPTVMANPDFAQFMPYRLELRNGLALREWLAEIRTNPSARPTR